MLSLKSLSTITGTTMLLLKDMGATEYHDAMKTANTLLAGNVAQGFEQLNLTLIFS